MSVTAGPIAGLNTMLTDLEIDAWLAVDASSEEICRGLVKAAYARGGLDNVTVGLVGIERPHSPCARIVGAQRAGVCCRAAY